MNTTPAVMPGRVKFRPALVTLETREATGSLLDLAVLGMAAGPDDLVTPSGFATDGRTVTLTAGAEWFDRPALTPPMTDTGKMADAQTAAGTRQPSSERRTALVDLVGPGEQAREFAVGLRWAAAGLPESVDVADDGTAMAPVRPTDGQSAHGPGPIFAPGLTAGSNWAVRPVEPVSDPEVVALPSSNYYCGPGPVQVIVKATVTEVDFLGDVIAIEADPGTDPYPTGPEYQDPNADGVIDLDAGDWAGPVGYPRGTYLMVSAKFKIEWDTWKGYPGTGEIKVNGACYGAASGILIPPTTVGVSADNNYLILPPTKAEQPFANGVRYGDIGISWGYMHNQAGQSSWKGAGTSDNELYVTLAPPLNSPVYHTSIHLPTSAAAYSTTANEVITKAWDAHWKPTQLKNRAGTKPLQYYGKWTAPDDTQPKLLASGDGNCYAHADFFVKALRDVGVGGVQYQQVIVNIAQVPVSCFLVKNWTFSQVGTGGQFGNPFTHQNHQFMVKQEYKRADGSVRAYDDVVSPAPASFSEVNGTWQYKWRENTVVEVSDTPPGVRGQNTTNPRSIFDNHVFVKTENGIYDPSYGTGPFQSVGEWEAASIAGFGANIAAVPAVIEPGSDPPYFKRDNRFVAFERAAGNNASKYMVYKNLSDTPPPSPG